MAVRFGDGYNWVDGGGGGGTMMMMMMMMNGSRAFQVEEEFDVASRAAALLGFGERDGGPSGKATSVTAWAVVGRRRCGSPWHMCACVNSNDPRHGHDGANSKLGWALGEAESESGRRSGEFLSTQTANEASSRHPCHASIHGEPMVSAQSGEQPPRRCFDASFIVEVATFRECVCWDVTIMGNCEGRRVGSGIGMQVHISWFADMEADERGLMKRR
jgi:hypothetical protein